MHIKWTVAYEYDGHFKPTIIYLSCFITKIIIGLIVSKFMYSLGNMLIVCPYRPTPDTMNSYRIIFNVIAIGLRFTKESYFVTDMIMRSNTDSAAMLHFLVTNCIILTLLTPGEDVI